MPILQLLVKGLTAVHTVLGPLADISELTKVFEGAQNAIKTLPNDMQAKIRRGDAFAQFRIARTKLDPKEQDAIRKILARLRNDQAKQEYFILKAAAMGGLDSLQDTVDFLKYLATMDTDEAVLDLEDTDTTQSSVTLTAAKGKLVQAAEAVGDAAKAVKKGSRKAVKAVDRDFKATGLNRWALKMNKRLKKSAGF